MSFVNWTDNIQSSELWFELAFELQVNLIYLDVNELENEKEKEKMLMKPPLVS